MEAWYEEFFDGLYAEVLARQFTPEATQQQADMIRRLLDPRPGQRVLDVPCGQGRIALELAEAGLDVTGVDLNERFVRRARRAARKRGLRVRFRRCDMREIGYDGEFDAVVNWFTSFGYFSDAENQRFLRAAFRALKPGGRLLIEAINKSRLLADYREETRHTVGGVEIVSRNRYDTDTSRTHSEWRFRKGKRVEKRRIEIRVYNGAEIRKALRAAGFREIRLFGRPPLGRLTRHSRRLIAIGTRPCPGN